MQKVIACFLLSATVVAQTAALPKYKVVKGSPAAENIAAINAAADQGYRVMISYRSVVLRLETTPPDTYRYLPLPDARAAASLLNALNQQGAFGYRWAETGVLEKEPHPRNYEYRSAEGFTLKSRDRSAATLVEQGFQQVHESLGGVIFIREIGHAQVPPSRPFRILYETSASHLMKRIESLAREGYRYRSPEASRGGRRAASMELCESTCGGLLEYRSFDVKNADQLQRDLNLLGSEGYRVVSKSLDNEPYFAERTAERHGNFSYRVVSAVDDKAAEEALNTGDREGFVPIGVAAHVGWSVQVYLILEKSTASPAP